MKSKGPDFRFILTEFWFKRANLRENRLWGVNKWFCIYQHFDLSVFGLTGSHCIYLFQNAYKHLQIRQWEMDNKMPWFISLLNTRARSMLPHYLRTPISLHNSMSPHNLSRHYFSLRPHSRHRILQTLLSLHTSLAAEQMAALTSFWLSLNHECLHILILMNLRRLTSIILALTRRTGGMHTTLMLASGFRQRRPERFSCC